MRSTFQFYLIVEGQKQTRGTGREENRNDVNANKWTKKIERLFRASPFHLQFFFGRRLRGPLEDSRQTEYDDKAHT